jgi:hypothetical protein
MTAKGNLNKYVVADLVKDVTPEQLNALFTSQKTGKACGLVSRARTVELLKLTDDTKKAVEEYTYPTKPKPRKETVKRGSVSQGTINKDTYKEMSNDKLVTSIQELSKQLQAMKDQLNDRLK